MNINTHLIKNIILPALILITLDGTYLFLRKQSLQQQIEQVQQHAPMNIRIWGVILCYLALVVGWYYFILRTHKSIWEAMLFGAVIYGTYETTNWATLKDWRVDTLIIDTLWGASLFGLATAIYYTIKKQS